MGHRQASDALVHRPLKTVNRIIRAFNKEGRIRDAPHRRRQRATTEEEDALMVAAVVGNPFHTAREVRELLDVGALVATGRRRLWNAGLKKTLAAQKPVLSASNKASRRQFAEALILWTAGDWGRVIFSDESNFTTRQDQRMPVWRTRGSRLAKIRFPCGYEPANAQGVAASGSACVNVWAVVSRHGLGPLHLIEGALTSQSYCSEILDDVFIPYAHSTFPNGDFLFQRDPAPVHTAKVVKEHTENRGIPVLSWPAKGADLNICDR
ncbi:hypothetical protein HPB50_017224 [Hyalomma asiaticum]|uniref:Uncharacterized protein n=1 Tax=Hyalomma asiaticum TaxID=266040 RepID=A0ACB7TM27_HYAAI|nr:hypothetical protein HPB50_017224 [Hyalomma asiaticum]